MGAAAAIASAVIGLGGAVYSSEKQKSAAEKSRRDAKEARRLEEQRAQEQFYATQPEEEGAKIEFGVQDDEELGSYGEFFTTGASSASAPSVGGLGFGTTGSNVMGGS